VKFTIGTDFRGSADDMDEWIEQTVPVLYIEPETDAERYQLAALMTKLHGQFVCARQMQPPYGNAAKVVAVDCVRRRWERSK
jgi:hypothetical protein